MDKRYYVEAETKPGTLINVYEGNDRTEAERLTEFWDERVNTYFHDRVMDAVVEQARKDAEQARINALPFREQLDLIVERMATEAQERLDKLATGL